MKFISRIKNVVGALDKVTEGYKKKIGALIGLGFLSAFFEGLGVGILVPLFSWLMNSSGPGSDFVSEFVSKGFGLLGLEVRMRWLVLFIACAFILKGIVLAIFMYVKERIVSEYEYKTRTALFELIFKASWAHLLKQKLGYVENLVMQDVTNTTKFLKDFVQLILVMTSLTLYTIFAFKISFLMTGVTIVLGSGLFIILKPLVTKTKLFSRERITVIKDVAHFVNEGTVGFKTVKAFGVEAVMSKVGSGFFKRLMEISFNTLMMRELTGIIFQPMSVLLVLAVFVISYTRLNFDFALFVAIMYLIQRIFLHIQKTQESMHKLTELAPSVSYIINFKEAINKNKEIDSGLENFSFTDYLEFKNVEFRYDSGKFKINDVSFAVKKGEMIGIIGPSGSGKTTIVDLLLRLFEPTGGQVLIDGNDYKQIKISEWRDNIGYMSQDIFVTNSSIAENIKFFNENITDKQMIEAAKMANIYEFIISLPQGYETIVGERGIFLSTGQRQRIILARVLARNPKILILDEATSALDNESEAAIKESIDKIRGKITIITIAHRLSTLEGCDKLVVIEGGKIVEQGKPHDLMSDKNSYFYRVSNVV